VTTAARIPLKRTVDERIFVASQWQLIWWKFRKHHLAMIGSVVVVFLYTLVLFCEFISPYNTTARFSKYLYAPPQGLHFVHPEQGFRLRPFVYDLVREVDEKTARRYFVIDKTNTHDVYFFVHGVPYTFWGLFSTDIHLFGTREADTPCFLMGTDRLGRDVLSRVLYGARISLSIGLIGIAITFFLGLLLGGLSGYVGGLVDTMIQRTIDLLISIPHLPLWMALAAALPRDWPPLRIYFGIVIVLSIVGWTGLARVVRGKLLALREEDFVMAARLAGSNDMRVIFRHLLPSFFSYIIVSLTLSIPNMILGETSLSFLGLGLQPPVVSWGVLLQDAQDVAAVAHYPWLLIPCLFVVATVLAFNFMGDGLRDAADPYVR
jgi:peptide/nickel transport system permease protein